MGWRMIQLIICGPGCDLCLALEKSIHKALIHLSMEGHVSHLDLNEAIEAYGPMESPTLVIDGEIVIDGNVASQEKIEAILKSYQ